MESWTERPHEIALARAQCIARVWPDAGLHGRLPVSNRVDSAFDPDPQDRWHGMGALLAGGGLAASRCDIRAEHRRLAHRSADQFGLRDAGCVDARALSLFRPI